jgi:hypothetical protein
MSGSRVEGTIANKRENIILGKSRSFVEKRSTIKD